MSADGSTGREERRNGAAWGSPALAAGPAGATAGLAAPLFETERGVLSGIAQWCALAVAAHLALLGWAWVGATRREMSLIVAEMRAAQRGYFEAEYEIEVEKNEPKKEEPPPEPPRAPDPEPAPRVTAPQPAAERADPYDPPPAPAEAGKVLTSDDEPVDLTGQGFVTGNGDGPGYGQVSAAGTGTAPTYNPNAQVGGTPTGTGKGPPAPPPPPPGPDRSRAPGLIGGTSWSGCPFPAEADADQIDEALVTLFVTVGPDGAALSARIASDPGHGFGRQARICALGKRYQPGLDREGNPTTSTTPPITVRFTRQ
jgi:protein TonB